MMLSFQPLQKNKVNKDNSVSKISGSDHSKPHLTIFPKLSISHPNEPYEMEADKIADQVMRMSDSKIHRKCSSCQMNDDEELKIHRKSDSIGGIEVSDDVANDISSMRGGGSSLDGSTRDFMESRFGFDFGNVRIHTDERASRSAESVNALAYTVGNDVVFEKTRYVPSTLEGRRLLAHELTHVVQQDSTSHLVQRYEAGEHAQLGETKAELTKLAKSIITYKVIAGDTLEKIATKFKITVTELKKVNKDKLKTWLAKDDSGRKIEGFDAGEEIAIPGTISEFIKETIALPEWSINIKGIDLTYGMLIAMADLFQDPNDIVNASWDELDKIAKLIKKEKSGIAGQSVKTADWEDATGGRYLKMAQKNESHFSPSNDNLVTTSGKSTENHKTEWEKWHRIALEKSVVGQKSDAMFYNAFGDHYLTDAFAAGHLINKRDVMELFKGKLPITLKDKDKEFLNPGTAEPFFDAVAKKAFVGAVKTEFSQYETVEFKGYVFRPNIDSEKRFSTLLQGIYMEEPDLLANAVARAVHDNLNTLPRGLSVVNNMGNKWFLSGDTTLNSQTRDIARQAVAQSQINVLQSYQSSQPLDFPALFKRVWDYTPQPDSAGTLEITSQVASLTTLTSSALINAISNLISVNYPLIIDELVKRKILKKA